MSTEKKKKSIPFWVIITIILLIGVLASIVVLLVSLDRIKDPPVMHTVTFAYQDGTVIEAKEVEEGKGVFPPKPKYDGVFRGWSGYFNSVKSDIEVHPIFYDIKESNLFYFDSVSVKEGKKFTLDLYVGGVVSVSSGTVTLSYDPDVLEYKKSKGLESLNVSEDNEGELTVSFDEDTSLKEKTLISQITFYAKKKNAVVTQIDVSAKDVKTVVEGQKEKADYATINNKIYFLQEVGK